jgi:formylglycine-generating enzyme required for sulfatase activity
MKPPDPEFDPYRVWLGVRSDRRPPNHFELLGLDPTETDSTVIRNASLRQAQFVRGFQRQHEELCARILEEIALAERTLIDAKRRAAYLASLPKRPAAANRSAGTPTSDAGRSEPSPAAQPGLRPQANPVRPKVAPADSVPLQPPPPPEGRRIHEYDAHPTHDDSAPLKEPRRKRKPGDDGSTAHVLRAVSIGLGALGCLGVIITLVMAINTMTQRAAFRRKAFDDLDRLEKFAGHDEHDGELEDALARCEPFRNEPGVGKRLDRVAAKREEPKKLIERLESALMDADVDPNGLSVINSIGAAKLMRGVNRRVVDVMTRLEEKVRKRRDLLSRIGAAEQAAASGGLSSSDFEALRTEVAALPKGSVYKTKLATVTHALERHITSRPTPPPATTPAAMPAGGPAKSPADALAGAPPEPAGTAGDSKPAPDRTGSAGDAEPDPARPEAAEEPEKEVENSIGMKFALVPAGTGVFGTNGRERTRIAKPFHLGVTEVTQGQWFEVMATRPWRGTATRTVQNVSVGDRFPAVYVSWLDAKEFCERLTARDQAARYRLPTEREWEYACRAKTRTRFSFGQDVSSLADHAWCRFGSEQGERHAVEVAGRKPNGFGLFDMHGNVREWCDEDFQGSKKVIRGGGWQDPPELCQSDSRDGRDAAYVYNNLGFRVVRESK